MKYLKYFLVVAVVVLAFSFTTKTSKLSEGVYPGDLMPNCTIRDDFGKNLDLSDLKGKKYLVSFWAAYDAESHKNNVLLYNTLQKDEYPITMVSVSFDSSESVFKQTLSMDRMNNPSLQFHEKEGNESTLFKKFNLKGGFRNYLVDEQGKIIAINVTPEILKELKDI